MVSTLNKFLFTILILVLFIGKTFAATYDWVGTSLTGGVYNWNDKNNWQINGAAANSIPGVADNVNIAVNNFSNNPTVTDAQKCASIIFGVFDNFSLTVNGTLTVSGDITQNNDPNLEQNTLIQGTGTITCNNFNLGDHTQPGTGRGVVIYVSSQVKQFSINGNIVLTAVGNGSDGIDYPFFSLDANKITLKGQIINKTYNSPTLEGVGDPNYPGYGLFQMDSFSENTTLELVNIAPVATPIPTGFTVDFTNDGTGTGTVIYDAPSGTQTIYTTGTSGLGINAYNYDYLTLSGASAKTVIGGALTIGHDLSTSGGNINLNTNNPTINVKGNWINTANITQASGNITIAGAFLTSTNTITLGSGSLTAGGSVQIASGKILAGAGAFTIGGAFQNDGTLKCSSGSVIFNGSYTNSKTFTAGTGTVYFSGSAQTLLDNSSTGGTVFNNVTFNGTGTSTMVAGTGNFTVSSSGVLTMVSPAKLVAGSASAAYLTLQSAATSSASVAAITGSSTITGAVNVQRYISGGNNHRGYRLLSSPVYQSTVSSNNIYSLNYLSNSCYLTGTTGIPGGFDKAGNPSVYLFRENLSPLYSSFLGSNFRGVNNMSTSPTYRMDVDAGTFNIPVGNGFMFFFRGDRSAAPLTTETILSYIPVSTTLKTTGTLNQGPITVKTWYKPTSANLGYTATTGNTAVRGYNLVGNPYASSINWDTFNATTSTTGIYGANIKPTFYVYNGINKNYAAYTAGSGGVGTNGGTNIIPSGQGFFVIAKTASAKLIFNESAKTTGQVTGSNLLMGKPADVATLQYLRLQMAADTVNTDDMVVRFDNTASADYVPNEDAPYRQGFGEVSICSISSNNVDLAINDIPLPGKKSDIIGVNVNAVSDGTYKLNLTQVVSVPQLYGIWLMDAYAKDSVDMRRTPSYSFNEYKNDTTSFGAKRFSLIIRQDQAYCYHLLSFTAAKLVTTPQVQLTWNTKNEGNYTNFTVERSTDGGKTFEVIGSQTASDQGTYSLLDKAPVNGSNLYRLKQVDLNGTVTYSQIVTVMYSDKDSALANQLNVYPNPAVSIINLSVPNSANNSNYNIKIVNSSGRVVKQTVSSQNQWQGNVSNLLTGSYVIQVVDNKDNSLIGQAKFVKL